MQWMLVPLSGYFFSGCAGAACSGAGAACSGAWAAGGCASGLGFCSHPENAISEKTSMPAEAIEKSLFIIVSSSFFSGVFPCF